jgi:hypothetical protein
LLRLPEGWLAYLTLADQEWIANTVFSASGMLAAPVKLWYYPPILQSTSSPSSQPKPANYFRRRLCLWIPRRKKVENPW